MRSAAKWAMAVILVMATLAVGAQAEREIQVPTTMLEMSPELGAEYHRIHGKIEAMVPDQALATALAERFAVWFESSGSNKPMTFEEAHDDLMGKLKGANRALDEAKKTGALETWLMPGGSQISMPVAAEEPKGDEKPQPVAEPPPTVQAAPTTEGPGIDAQRNSEGSIFDRLTLWAVVPASVAAFLMGLLGYKLQPKLFESQAQKYNRPQWRRFVARVEVAIIAGGVTYCLVAVVIQGLLDRT